MYSSSVKSIQRLPVNVGDDVQNGDFRYFQLIVEKLVQSKKFLCETTSYFEDC